MKKPILAIVVLAIAATSIFAVDISYETGKEQSLKKDKSMSVKSSSENRHSNRKFDAATDSKSYSADVTFDPTPIYLLRANQCAKTIAVAKDFGLTALMDGEDDDMVDLNRKASIDLASSSSISISKIPGARENEIKDYIGCIITESAKMAQANLNLERKFGTHTFSGKEITHAAANEFQSIDRISDPSIRLQFASALNSLKQPCRFLANMGHDSIQCGTLTFSFTDNTVRQSGTLISAGQNFWGVTSSLRVSMSDTRTDGRETAFENSNSDSRDATLTQSAGSSMSRNQKQSTNVAPFLPK